MLCVSGFGGNNLFLLCTRPGHSNRMCLVVSYAYGQCLQCGPWRGFSRFRCIFTAACPVLNWNMRLWSGLYSLLMGSFFFGLLLSANKARPVVPAAHSFSQSSFDWFFSMFLAVAIVHGLSCCAFCVPSCLAVL